MCNFRRLSNNPYDFLKFKFYISLPKLGYFWRKKETLNFRIQKCYGERYQKMSHFRNTSNCIKIFGKILLKPL